jgi:excisionase family DNA binding protein
MDDTETPLFVRLPPRIAERLDRAAFELRLSKKELVTALLSRHMDDEAPDGRDRLRQIHDEVEHFRMATGLPRKKKVLYTFTEGPDGDPDADPHPGDALPGPGIGNVAFRAFEPAEVLSLADAAELLQVAPEDVEALATNGELPGRKIGEAWRFSRVALLRWLGCGPAG